MSTGPVDTTAVPVADLVSQLDDLPSLPAVVMELLSCIDVEEVDISVLAKKVSHDQALTAKTLRLANSSTYGLQVKVTTIQQAITFLGFQTTRNLITAAAVTGCFPQGKCPGFDDKAFWRHSIATAVCARVLARRMRFNQDYAFTAGLLHDIGRLVLVTLYPAQYGAVLARAKADDTELLAAEQAVLGTDHVAAGLLLADHWQFSDTIRMALAHHHDPDSKGAGLLATIVHISNAIVHALDMVGDEDEAVPPVSPAAWKTMGLSEEAYVHVFRETEVQFDEIAAALMA
jgi:putative nucleotidyltransferase with HDIG domain